MSRIEYLLEAIKAIVQIKKDADYEVHNDVLYVYLDDSWIHTDDLERFDIYPDKEHGVGFYRYDL